MKFDITMTLAADVTLRKDVRFRVEARSKGEAKRHVDTMLDDLQAFIEGPDGDELYEILKAQGFDVRNIAAYDEIEIESIGADGDEYDISRANA